MGTKINSNYEDLLTFTRASKGHALRPVSYGTELVTNGGFDTDSNWVKGSSWSISGGVASADGTVGGATLRQELTNTAIGDLLFIEYTISNWNSTGTHNALLGSTASANNTGNGTFYVALVQNGDKEINIQTKGGAAFDVDNVSVKEVLFDQPDGTLTLFEHPNNVPRVEYDADGNRLGLLVEESRTNLIPYSDFSTGWAQTRSTLTQGAITSPDGQSNGASIKASTDNNSHYIADVITVTSSTRYTTSVFFKAGGKNWATIWNGNGNVYFDLENGAVGSITGTNNTTAQIQEVGNNWYKCSISFDASSASYNLSVGPAEADGDNTYVGDNSTEEIYVYGIQLEAGSFPTSYIKTTGSTASRSADVASIPVADFGYNQSAGTVFVEAQGNSDSSLFRRFLNFEETSSKRWEIIGDTGEDVRIYAASGSGADVNADVLTNVLDGNTMFKMAFAKAENDAAASGDGGAVVTDTANGQISGVVNLYIGSGSAGASDFACGHIKSIKYYPRRLTNAQLEALTEPRSTPTLSLTFDGLESSYTENYIHG